MGTLLKVKDLAKKGDDNFLLSGITFSQKKHEQIAIAGETGAGKSTLLKLIAGLMQPDSGDLLFEGRRIPGPDERLVPGHPGIGYLSQHFELQKSLRVEQVLAYANALTDRVANRLFTVCQIDHLLSRRTDQLSGGEKQRVAICRLLISSPRLLLLDEPFSHLDMMHKHTLKDVIRDIGEKLRITCIMVSHDPLDTLSWAAKILVMKDGRIIQAGDPNVVYRQPVNAYSGGLFGKYNLVDPEKATAFAKLPAVKTFVRKNPGKKIFFRPEHVILARKTARSVRGKIEKNIFYGSFRELEVSVPGALITLRANAAHAAAHGVVYLSVSAKDMWPL